MKMDLDQTDREYNLMRKHLTSANLDPLLLPHFNTLMEEKKKNWPDGIYNNEMKAEVSLQNLLDVTCKRFLESFGEQISYLDTSLKRIFKCGMDGQSGHANYQQPKGGQEFDDSKIFCISAVLLRLVDSNGSCVWKNKTPNSPDWCRPLHISFSKENVEISVEWRNKLVEQIEKLIEYHITLHGRRFEVTFEVYLTMMDGLMRIHLTDQPNCTNSCPICLLKPKDRMNWNLVKKETHPIIEYLRYGISPLHLWLRCLDFCLNASFKLDVKTHRPNDIQKKEVATRTQIVKDNIEKDMKLFVCRIVQGKGTSNTGNVARKFFRDFETAAKCTGLNQDLIRRFFVLLTVINSGFKLNPVSFQKYADETEDMVHTDLGWYGIPPSVHAMLNHTIQVQEMIPFNIGEGSESALESAHKRKLSVRENHTRKNSRAANILDVFHWELLVTDPVILDKSQKEIFKTDLPPLTPEMKDLIQLE